MGRLIVEISWGGGGSEGELEIAGGDAAQDHALQAAEVIEAAYFGHRDHADRSIVITEIS
jgi:hypothetical protein